MCGSRSMDVDSAIEAIRRMIFAMNLISRERDLFSLISIPDLHEEEKKRILFVVQDEFYVAINLQRSSDVTLLKKGS